ncbi:MAG: hypothetical protein JWM09_968 [Francisellaceae bacterium]|nr:hypothetical protein [Francisellaceae bacterium]
MKIVHTSMLFIIISLLSGNIYALTFPLEPNQDLIGQVQTAIVNPDESLGEIGRRFDIGVYEMIEANRHIDPWVPHPGTEIIIPSQFILPPGPREGIVLNLAEMRLYHYHDSGALVSTYPIGIGTRNWTTPLATTAITAKIKHPSWRPPQSIRAEHALKGDILPLIVPAGPDNPLGNYAFRMGLASILIHGTNKPGGVGLRSSHGCVRLLPADIEELYKNVAVGTKVRIIHEPYKAGWYNNNLYLEAHDPLTESRFKGSDDSNHLVKTIEAKLAKNPNYNINWRRAGEIAKQNIGLPARIDSDALTISTHN